MRSTTIFSGILCMFTMWISVRPVEAALPATQPAPPSVRLRVARVDEKRYLAILPKYQAYTATMQSFSVYLQVSGLPGIGSATGFGRWVVDTATDDRGTDLRPSKMPDAGDIGSDAQKQATGYEGIDREATDDLVPGPDGYTPLTMAFKLAQPARNATVIRQLTGHFDLSLGGKDHVARFTRPTALIGQTLADDEMRRAGVWITFDKPDPSDGKPDPRSVSFHFHGDPSQIHDSMLDILDGDGKTVVSSWDASGPSSEVEHAHTFSLTAPLDDSMVLTVRIRSGQQTLALPFDFKNVPLP